MHRPSLDLLKKFVIGNWKMYLGYRESIDLAFELENKINFVHDSLRVVICPSFPVLSAIRPVLKDLYLGAQDAGFESAGAYTGQISIKMLKEIGCAYVILGHSERRKFFKESDEMINDKIKMALDSMVTPIVCVGETAPERQAGRAQFIVGRQLERCLAGVQLAGVQHLLIAYEPVWAIGTGLACAPEDAISMHQYIRRALRDYFSDFTLRNRIWIIYGGSVDRGNFLSYLQDPHIDGVLIGGA
ncbi:MAG: triose-phosphate isomerase, partial [Parcubacteria group bacterium]|nr:triose-phosphate isomerase [Parcubacteria group bacterium]